MADTMTYSNLIRASKLHDLLQETAPAHLRLIDARFSLSDPQEGRRRYVAGHLPGAVYLSLDEHLSSPPHTQDRQHDQQHGGRHPLPDMQRFAHTLGALGIGNATRVVVYDDVQNGGGMFAARLWWLLRYAGHDAVQVLDGGVGAWTEAGFGLSSELPAYPAETFSLALRAEMVAHMDGVRAKLGDPGVVLLDARAPERYRGEVEPLDKKAGHIPGALNKPYTENLERGLFKPAGALSERFTEAQNAAEVILYCGSGVSAAHNALALEEAGIVGAKLYVGSWSEWSSYDENPVATGKEP